MSGGDIVYTDDAEFDDLKGDFMSGLLTNPDLQETADYTVTEAFTADTADHMDHTFCGLMCDVRCREDTPPLEFIQLQGIRVRGDLGRVRVFVREGGYEEVFEDDGSWVKVHDMMHPSSPHSLVLMEFNQVVVLCPGQTYGIYVHSSIPDDTGIVYDNQRGYITFSDTYIDVLPGAAHLNPEPFRNLSPWGTEGWRFNRQLVGSIIYGVKFRLWTPMTHTDFPGSFKKFAAASLWAMLKSDIPTDLAFHVLNMCRYNWTNPGTVCSIRDIAPGMRLKTIRQDGAWSTHPVSESIVTVNFERMDGENPENDKLLKGVRFEIDDPTSELPIEYHRAVREMIEGEKCQVLEDGEGEDVRTTIHLVKVENFPMDSEASIWTKILEADRRREQGNKFYALNHISFAKFKYERGMEFFTDLPTLRKDEMDAILASYLPLLLNSAACSLHLHDYYEVLPLTTAVLRHEPTNIKALTRRAKANYHLNHFQNAMADVVHGLSIEPDNQDLLSLQATITAEQKRHDSGLKGRLRGLFSG
eukprot:TRINITY_DN3436_c0_g9_i1.p1 TRINITY_DN3436_c0_g9~~TRINITY_DN3436_c0_g9_i1.p1  ORF type:complete len:547 (+),score=62.79 TRINITY_DN3436_c0_g9_i1:56-1642(+)